MGYSQQPHSYKSCSHIKAAHFEWIWVCFKLQFFLKNIVGYLTATVYLASAFLGNVDLTGGESMLHIKTKHGEQFLKYKMWKWSTGNGKISWLWNRVT